jgi:transposase InsO family protein
MIFVMIVDLASNSEILFILVSRKSNVLDLVLLMCTTCLGGAAYFNSFINDYARKIWVYLLKKTSDAFDAFKSFHAFVTTQKGTELKCLRTNNGSAFTSAEFKSFCDLHGELTYPYNPSSNGVAKWYSRALCEQVLCMLSATNLPHKIFGRH